MKSKGHQRRKLCPDPVDVVLVNKSQNPHCHHGPTLHFKRRKPTLFNFANDITDEFYACAVYRDKKACGFFMPVGKESPPNLNDISKKEEEFFNSHCEKYDEFSNRISSKIFWCIKCCTILLETEKTEHSFCPSLESISKEYIDSPSKIIPAKIYDHGFAQYFYTQESVDFFLSILKQSKIKKLLCIGTPRLHEAIKSQSLKISSFLLDIDSRYCNFLSTNEFAVYNIFNHYFYGGSKSKDTYRQFLLGSENILVILDPPFGGVKEALFDTLEVIEHEWRDINGFPSKKMLPFLCTLPYFMESSIRRCMESINMLDYQVTYENYPSGAKDLTNGSVVRIYTNLSPKCIPISKEGYWFCEICNRWSYAKNAHCHLCKACTSKDGKPYKHCDICGYCVKQSWTHCSTCKCCSHKNKHQCNLSETPPKKKVKVFKDDDAIKKLKVKKPKTQNSEELPASHKQDKERSLRILTEVLRSKKK